MRTKGKSGVEDKDPKVSIPWDKLSKKQKRKIKKSKAYRKAYEARLKEIGAKAYTGKGQKDKSHGKARADTSHYLDKDIRNAMKMPTPPKNPYAALMEPMVIVPDDPEEKVVVADAGTIVRLMDQAVLYRDRVSPITRRGDELLVQYGAPGKLKLGWLTNKQSPKIMKPSKGPTFLVMTKSEDALVAWEQVRLLVARTRKTDPTNWIAPWLATNGAKHPKLLREVTRYFGGKPIKNEPFEERCARLFQLILSVELDMATAKTSKSKKVSKKNKGSKKNKDVETETPSKKSSKKSKKEKKTKKVKSTKSKKSKSDRITKADDERVIIRRIKENPRRAGSKKAKIWDKLKKGMTVGEFVAKGGGRAHVGYYIKNGWVKLSAAPASDE